MNAFEKDMHGLLMNWCRHKAREERKLIGRCRTAYKQPVLAGLTNRYADTLEAAAKLFDDLHDQLEKARMDAETVPPKLSRTNMPRKTTGWKADRCETSGEVRA